MSERAMSDLDAHSDEEQPSDLQSVVRELVERADPTIAELKMEVTHLHGRLQKVEKQLLKLGPEVVDLRVEVASLTEQVSRGNRISLETQGEMRNAFVTVQLQLATVQQLLERGKST